MRSFELLVASRYASAVSHFDSGPCKRRTPVPGVLSSWSCLSIMRQGPSKGGPQYEEFRTLSRESVASAVPCTQYGAGILFCTFSSIL